MRYAIVADIHGNLAALKAVLDDIEQRGGVDGLWCLGDIVGYGPEPGKCLALLRKKASICVAGNHDRATTGKLDTTNFNSDATEAILWTAKQLSHEDISYLNSLPLVAVNDNFTLVHGSPGDPLQEYLVSIGAARQNFNYFETQSCLVGHSHRPIVFACDEAGECSMHEFHTDMPVKLEGRFILNPGGLGQPRDGDPRAAYAIYDSKQRVVNLHRVHYDIGSTQKKLRAYGLPLRLSTRLSYGL